MKKTVLIVAAALALISCKRDYICKCTDGQGNTLESAVIHDTKSNAKGQCAGQPLSQINGVSCALQ